jgi:hypothetical protein
MKSENELAKRITELENDVKEIRSCVVRLRDITSQCFRILADEFFEEIGANDDEE